MDNNFPELTDSFLAGQDIMYSQFNSVDFYVEDLDQENFYFQILKKLFPLIKFEKIFPLNGKDNVKRESSLNVNVKNKIYIVDLDFDEILGWKVNNPNLFYLKRYSIENYLIDKKAIYEIIREKKPSLKNSEIETHLDYDDLISKSCECLVELTILFLIIQKHSLGLSYQTIEPNRDFDFDSNKPYYKGNIIADFRRDVESALKIKNKRYTLNAQCKNFKINFASFQSQISIIPGKYILSVIKNILQSKSLISQSPFDSFCYKLSKDINPDELEFLKTNILQYLST